MYHRKVFSYILSKDPSINFVGSYFFTIFALMEQEKLYQLIEAAIIRWSNDGTKTAGTLTREILEIINNN